MDWSSSQWKEGLSSTALQKINALEEKIEKLQKERQQKQTQFECLELLLDKEKRKVEQEKQQTSRLERELQSLSDTCKNLENKQQKLLIEIQNRDSRQNNLEAQLAQAKKQNCRLQQLEKDIEELRCLRENTKLEHKELEEKLKKEQSTIVKQNDAITDLEQTIKSLQEKSLSSSLIVISDKSLTMDANKENIDTFHNVGDDKNSESLRKKILEQENIINNLKEQLKNTSSGKEKMGPPSDILTPIKTNASERSTNNSFSVWDSFGATPSKAGKAIKHHSDSSAFDDSDEKMRNLQLKVKQLSQELECQRHNSEAAKNALEQRLKEKENVLKAEIKQQAQEIQDLDKELREIQNKYQQDVVQTNKKLDIVNAQLQKSELLKQQMEKDLKALELQINSRNTELQQKDEELKDLQKIKNNYEATAKKLNSEKRELEQSYNALQAQKNSWHEEVRDLKMQLEGSNNLVKEKETLLHNMKKENDHLSRVNLEFQTKIQAINKELSASQSEKCHLEKKLQDFDANITSLKENLKVISEEKKNICSLLDLEKTKSAKLECDLMANKKDKVSLQSEVENNEKLIDSLKAELEQLKNNSDVKIKMLENEITTSNGEISSLKNKLTEFTQKEMSMQETIKQLKDENDKIANSLEVVSSEKTSMESHIKELMSQLALLQTDNKSKDEMMNLLKKEAADMKENYEVKIKILENTVTTSSAEISSLNNKLSESAKNEVFIQGAMKQLKEESQKTADSLKVANSEKASMESHIKELMSQLTLLQTDNKSKNEKINQLNKDVADLKENYEVQVTKLKDCVAISSAEISSLKEKLSEFTKNEMSMQETIQQLNEENNKLTDSLKVLNSEKMSMESHTKELTSQLVLLQTDNKSKDEKINQLKKEAVDLKENYEVQVTQLRNSGASSSAEISSLKEKLSDFTKIEMSMQETIKQLKEENNKLTDSLKILNSEKTSVESHTKELTSQLELLQTHNKSKDEKINQLKKEVSELKENYEVQVTQLGNSVASSSAEILSLKEKLSEFNKNEMSMQETIKQLKEENNKLTDSLKILNSEKTSMESHTKELTSQLVLLQTDNKSKDEKINQLKKDAADLKENYEVQVSKLGNSVASSSAEISSLKEKLSEFAKNEMSMQETIKKLKEENNKITDSLKVLNSEKTSMESHTKELMSQLVLFQTENKSKDEKINQLKKEAADLKEHYEIQVTKLGNSVTSSSTEISSLKEKLCELTNNEMSMHETIKQLKEENNKLTDSLKVLNSEKTSMESHTKELTSQLVLLQTDNKCKDEKINQLKKEDTALKEDYEMKVQELEKSMNSTNVEMLSLKDKLRKFSENELSLQEELEQLQVENNEIKNSLKVVNSEKASMDSHIEELVSQLTALQTDNKLQEDKIILLIKEAADLKENYDKTIDELKKSVNSYSAENSSLQKKLVESTEKNILVQENMSKLEEENKRISSLLNDIDAMESSTQEMKSQLNAVQITLTSKEEELAKLKGEFADLEKKYNDQIKEIEKEKLEVVDSLSNENIKNAELENIVKELNIKISDLQNDLDIKKELINSFNAEMSNCKEDYEAKLLELRETLEVLKSENDSISSQAVMYLSNENNLKETLEKIEDEKKIISDSLACETEKCKMLESQVEQLKNNISELEYDIISGVGNELSLKTEIISLKEDYEARFLEYKNTLETLKSDNESLLNQVKDFVLNELSVRESLEKAENEKDHISDVLSTETKQTQLLESKVVSLTNSLLDETKKTQLLESKVVSLMNNLRSQEYFVISKIASELVLNTEMERIKEIFKNKISELQLNNVSLTSKVFTLQEELKEISLREKSLIKRLEETKVECQNVEALASSERVFRKRIEDLLIELNQKNGRINSLESEIASLIENHEMKVQDLEKSLNSVNAKIFALQDKLHESSENELTLREELKKLQLENSETANLFKDINSEKVSMESSIKELVSQLTALQTDNKLKEEKITLLIKEAADLKENYDKEKAKINVNIADVKMNLLSMLDSMGNISAQSEALQNEICCIKEECQETQLKMTCDQKARLELLCDLLNQLNTIENHVEVLVLNYEGEIALLKTQFCELEYQIASKSEECSGWFEEKENLIAKIKCIEDKLNLKELELENSILKLHEYLVTIKNVQNDNEVLTIENEKLQEEISHLKDEFHAMDSLIATKNSEYENILDEKTTLYEELKMIEGKLHEKESHLEDLILFKKEQMVVTESLNSIKEKLEQENKQLVNEVSNLKNKLSEMESQRATKCLEYEIISKENVNLHQKIKLLEHRLKGKELELQNNSSVTNEMSTLIEKLEDVKKTLILENTELQDEISCLKNKLIEIESGCEDISNKYILVEEEKKNLMEKVRLMEEEISEKKSNLLNTHKQLVAIENLKNTKENLTHEKTELQAKLSSLSIIMMTAENILQKISSKIADVTLNSQNEFAAVQLLQEQSVKSSKDLHNFTCDYIRDKNAVQTKIKEIEEVCEFVLESLSVFQDHYASCQNLNIPDCIKLEIQNIDSSKIKCEDPRPMCVAYCNGDTVHYSSSTERSVEKFKEELEHKFKDMYNKTSSFEERILAAKERFKFLIHHKLVATDDFGKMHATLKYMKKLHIILHSKKIALESIKSGCQLLQPKNESSEDVFNLISLLSNNCNANNDVNSYFEKCLLVNTYKDLYLTSKMKKVLTSFKSFIDLEISNFEQHFACYKQYDNIEYHYLHKPVVIKMDYLLFLHRLSFDSFHKEKKLINSLVNHGKKIEICAFLDKICAAKVPLIVNCLFKLHERSLSKFDENLVNINLISHIVKKLVLFYAENHPSMSSGTCIHIENFLYLLSKVSIYNITNEKHLILLQNLMYSLLEDLLLMRESFNDEKEQTEDLFDVLINEIDNLKSENTDKQNQIHLLEESLTEERKQKQILDLHANEIVENLNSMVILKKNWERKILEISKLCSVLKNIFDCNNINECDILKLQSEFDALSDNFCLCEECLVAESESQRDVNHIAFTPVNLIHFVAELYMSKTESEKEIMQLKTINTDISQKIIMLKSELENARLEHSTLEQSMCGLKEKLNAKEYELDRLMSKCSCLEDEYQSLNTQFLEINNKYKDLQKAFDDKLSELNKCKQQYEELFSENEQIKDGIMLKEQKIAQCEQTILEHSILKNTLEELREKVDAKEYELENWKTNYSCLENKYQNLNIQFLEKDSEYKDVDKAFNDKLNELDKCKQQYEELFSENQKIKEEIALKEEKIVQYEKTISEHFTLEQCLCELKEKINVKDCELENMKTKYLCLEDEYKSLNAQILETNIKSKELQKAFDDKLNELNECKQQYQELLSENEEIKNELRLKEQKIAQYEQTTSEKMSEYEILLAKSADFEARIHDLNNTINSLNSHVKESNNKLENLEKAKSLLNTTLENVEEELQNTYSEKQKLEENLQEKNSEIERLQQEISSTNNKLTNAENEISNLKITIKELKDTLKGNEKEYDELKNKNCKLQNEICSLTKLIKELKVSIIEKNLSIQKNESIVSELKKNISECDDEKKNLEMKVMILSDELEKKISLMYNLESKLDKTTAEKDDLQKQIADLLSLNYSKAHEDENSYKTKCDQFTSENSSLRLEIENLTQEKINLENNIKEYCDKICALEEELKKADQMQENLSHERDDLKKNLHILKRDMQIKNKSHVENSLFMQELAQKVDKLRNELSESGQIAAKKIKELSQENSSLHAEICLLKSQSNVDYKNNTNSVIDTSNFKSSNNLKEFLKKFVGVLIEAIKKTECNNDIGKYKSECLSQLGKWEDNITDSDSYINDIYKKLHSFLQYYVSMQKDLESKLDNLTKAVFKHVTELNKYCEESEDCVNCFNVTALGEISYLNETMYGDSTTSINCDINKLTHELQNSCQKLNTRFNSLRTTILNREMEVKSLQDDLSQMQQLKENPPNGEQNTDGKVQNLEIKCKMLLSNARRLEKKHNNLLKTCEEMENHIKTLEKEKQELENEAEEMATMLRDQTSSDEVLEISIRLAEKNKQLEHLKEENSCLKSHLKRYESFVKENSLSVSKIAEQSQSDSS